MSQVFKGILIPSVILSLCLLFWLSLTFKLDGSVLFTFLIWYSLISLFVGLRGPPMVEGMSSCLVDFLKNSSFPCWVPRFWSSIYSSNSPICWINIPMKLIKSPTLSQYIISDQYKCCVVCVLRWRSLKADESIFAIQISLEWVCS